MENTITDILTDLQKFYGKKLSESQSNFYRSELAELDETDLCSGVLAVKRSEPPGLFPSMITIRKYCFQAKEQRLDREKAKAPIFDDLKRNADRTQHGRESIRRMIDLYEGTKTRAQYLAGMREMEVKYPGVGWKQNADELKEFWATEEQRYAIGRKYLERIWRLQDKAGFPAYNNPDWYLKRLEEDPL